MTCNHSRYTESDAFPFFGTVASSEERTVRAAHGSIVYVDVCPDCGARRKRAVNQRHEEVGDWGQSRAQRQALADKARQAIPAGPAPITNGQVQVSCDSDGMIVVTGGTVATHRLPPAFVAGCAAVRQAVLEYETMRDDVWSWPCP